MKVKRSLMRVRFIGFSNCVFNYNKFRTIEINFIEQINLISYTIYIAELIISKLYFYVLLLST